MKKTAALFWLSYLCYSIGSVFAADSRNVVLAAHTADLVALQGEKLTPFKSATFLLAPYTVLYFSAGWCPDCRHFSPSLVEAYNHQPAGGSRYEVVLVSRDRNAEEMLKYMKSERMPWPALAFEKVPEAKDLAHFYSGQGIPCLTVLDSKGTVVLQSKSDQDATEVLQQLIKLVGQDGKSKASSGVN
jgi:thiol-disulfide isomerase/thioredoxin